MSFEFFMARRYLKGRSPYLKLMSLFSTTGVTLGVASLITVLGVMTGLRKEIREKILGTSPHILVLKVGGKINGWREIVKTIDGIEGVKTAFPFIISNGLLRSEIFSSSVILHCSDPTSLRKAFKINKMMRDGVFFEEYGETTTPPIVIGRGILDSMDVKVGDVVWLVSPFGTATPLGYFPMMKKYKIVGAIEVGISDYDSSFVFMKLSDCMEFLSIDDWVASIGVMLDDPDDARKVSLKMLQKLGFPFYSKTWYEMNKNLFAAMQLEKVGMGILLTLIIIVASFNIFSTINVLTREKTRDIAIMKTFGVTSKSIKRMFTTLGLWIGLRGITFGTIIGLLLCFLIKKYGIVSLPEDVYYVSQLPVKVQIQDVAATWALALVISFIASRYPASRASKIEPFEALRYE